MYHMQTKNQISLGLLFISPADIICTLTLVSSVTFRLSILIDTFRLVIIILTPTE